MMEIKARGPYSFEETLRYMKRQDDCLYTVKNDAVYKAESFGGHKVLMKLTAGAEDSVQIEVSFNEGASSEDIRDYCIEWLDLGYDLESFYEFACGDQRLGRMVEKRHGYRMVGKVDITDAFLWAILGQQITMSFAYVLKRRVVEYCGHHLEYEGERFLLAPGGRNRRNPQRRAAGDADLKAEDGIYTGRDEGCRCRRTFESAARDL